MVCDTTTVHGELDKGDRNGITVKDNRGLSAV